MHTLICLLVTALLLAGTLPADAAGTRRISSSKTASSEQSGAKHALLVGINDYPAAPLNGTLNDVAVWKEALTSRYGFPADNVTTLLDRRATKAAILNELQRLERTTKPGDTVLFFFSGHGTSSYDPEVKLDMGPATGALVPADAKLSGSREALLDSLLVGRRDLRPILEKMDQDRHVIVVVDACYSGNAVRSLAKTSLPGRRGIPKFLPLTLPTAAMPSPQTMEKSDSSAGEPYPYRNILYIAAANDREKAMDLPSDPYDGKPHGALTGAMMRGMRGDADSNNDGIVSYDELYRFARKDTQQQGHTPQLLADASFDRTRRIFNAAPALKKSQRSAFSAKGDLLVRLDGQATGLSGQLQKLPGVKLAADGEYDLLITADAGEYLLSLANGDLVTRMRSGQEVHQRIERYQAVRDLVGRTNPDAKFNVSLTVGGDSGKSVFLNGEQISFQVAAEEDASLLLLNIDPQGYVSVIFPASSADNSVVRKGTPRSLGEAGTVSEPLGVEQLKLFAFRRPVEALKHFAGRSPIDPMGSEFAELQRILKQNTPKGPGWAETTVEVVTTRRP